MIATTVQSAHPTANACGHTSASGVTWVVGVIEVEYGSSVITHHHGRKHLIVGCRNDAKGQQRAHRRRRHRPGEPVIAVWGKRLQDQDDLPEPQPKAGHAQGQDGVEGSAGGGAQSGRGSIRPLMGLLRVTVAAYAVWWKLLLRA